MSGNPEVSGSKVLVLGTAQLTRPYGLLAQSVVASGDNPLDLLRSAITMGFSAVDTAPVYTDAERIVRDLPKSVEVHTKFDPQLEPRQSIARSLEALGRSSVEVAYFHDPRILDDNPHLVDLAKELIGKEIGLLGASIYDAKSLKLALEDDDISVVQLPANIANRTLANSLVERPRGILRLGRSVFAQGVLISPPENLPPKCDGSLRHLVQTFQGLCDELRRSPVETALQWSLCHPGLDGIVLGFASLEHLREVHRALSAPPLTPEEMRTIEVVLEDQPVTLDPRRW